VRDPGNAAFEAQLVNGVTLQALGLRLEDQTISLPVFPLSAAGYFTNALTRSLLERYSMPRVCESIVR